MLCGAGPQRALNAWVFSPEVSCSTEGWRAVSVPLPVLVLFLSRSPILALTTASFKRQF